MSENGERATGLLSSVFGLAVMLAMLGVLVNVALGLWARSSTESIAYEAAASVATTPSESADAARGAALERARELLGSRASQVELSFSEHGSHMVELHVRAPGVRLLPAVVAGGGPIVADLDRTIRIRREDP